MLDALFWVVSYALLFASIRRLLAVHCAEERASIAFTATLVVGGTLGYALGRIFGHLSAGLWLTAALCLLASRLGPRRAPAPPSPGEPPHRFVAPLLLLLFAMAMTTTWLGYQFDEHRCHVPLSTVLARDILPPQHPYFPGEPFRYHFAFDVLVAQAIRAGFSVIRGIDVITTASFIAFLWTSMDLGRTLAGRWGASLGSVVIPMGTGTLLFLAFAKLGFGPLVPAEVPLPSHWYSDMFDVIPPVISNFFQHPQGLGMPLMMSILMLAGQDAPSGADAPGGGSPSCSRRRFVAAAVLTGTCSLVQFSDFLMLGLSLGVASLLVAYQEKAWSMFGFRALCLLGAALLALCLGGFLSPGQTAPTAHLIWGRAYFKDGLPASVLRHFVNFGFPLFLLPVAFWRMSRPHRLLRIALLTGAIVGFALPNLATYERSWDIVKFYLVGGLFANALLVDWLAEVLPSLGPPRSWRLALGVGLALLLLTGSSWIWFLRNSFFDGGRMAGIPNTFEPPKTLLGAAIVEKLGPELGPTDRVLATNMDEGAGGGFLTPGITHSDMTFMVDMDRVRRYADALERARHHLAKEDLELLDVKFVSLGPGDFDALAPDGLAATQDERRLQDLGRVETPEGSRHLWRVVR